MLEAKLDGGYRLIAIRVLIRMPVFNSDFKYFYLSEYLTLNKTS